MDRRGTLGQMITAGAKEERADVNRRTARWMTTGHIML
ncbi:MAG: hypothetical protein QG597_533 [Actinomycetota bacterium]|nr:hypothetical protein [Actinomycetota bacterium]